MFPLSPSLLLFLIKVLSPPYYVRNFFHSPFQFPSLLSPPCLPDSSLPLSHSLPTFLLSSIPLSSFPTILGSLSHFWFTSHFLSGLPSLLLSSLHHYSLPFPTIRFLCLSLSPPPSPYPLSLLLSPSFCSIISFPLVLPPTIPGNLVSLLPFSFPTFYSAFLSSFSLHLPGLLLPLFIFLGFPPPPLL